MTQQINIKYCALALVVLYYGTHTCTLSSNAYSCVLCTVIRTVLIIIEIQ